jgi:ParB/RepB/Spo0J family partition protein
MPTIPISEIKITRRQRKELDHEEVEALADSIDRWGLLHPITLRKEDNSLVAGFRRVQAHLALNKKEIEFRYHEELTDIETKELELEENIRRVNLTWQEEAQAIAEIHNLKQELDPDWTTKKTAEFVGKSAGTVSQAVSITREAEKDPSVWDASGVVSAKKKIDRRRKLEARKIRASSIPDEGPEALIVEGDAGTLIGIEPDEEYNAIITNFPFGVDLQFKDGERPYEDDETYITDLIMDMVPDLYRVLKKDSWLVAFFDIRKMTYNSFMAKTYKPDDIDSERAMGLKHWLERAGFSYVSMLPFIWVKPNKTQGLIGNPDRGMVVSYEAGLFAAKGDPTLNKHGRQNIFIYDTLTTGERDFSVEMPPDLCDELVQMVCYQGEKILDPFAGSGAIGSAALRRDCSFMGFEIDPERAELGNLKLKETKHGTD